MNQPEPSYKPLLRHRFNIGTFNDEGHHHEGVLFSGSMSEVADALAADLQREFPEHEIETDIELSMSYVEALATEQELQECYRDSGTDQSYDDWYAEATSLHVLGTKYAELGFTHPKHDLEDNACCALYWELENELESIFNTWRVHEARKGTDLEHFNTGSSVLSAKYEGKVNAILFFLEPSGIDGEFDAIYREMRSNNLPWFRMAPAEYCAQFSFAPQRVIDLIFSAITQLETTMRDMEVRIDNTKS